MLSIVIPTLNEAQTIGLLLHQLSSQKGCEFEVLVADGGSSDETVAIAGSFDVQVVSTPPGRGSQMNMAVARSRGEHLLFLHADSEIPEDESFLADALKFFTGFDERTAGHFPLEFTGNHEPGAYLYYEAKTRTSRPYSVNGDQGMLVSRTFFQACGGYREELPFLEDQYFSLEVIRLGRWVVLPGKLRTSARRFEQEGFFKRMTLSALLMSLFASGNVKGFLQNPRLYQSHSESGELLLTPFFMSYVDLYLRPSVLNVRFVESVGEFIRGQVWQVGHLFDVLLVRIWGGDVSFWEKRSGLFSVVLDFVVEKITRNRFFRWLGFLLGIGWYGLTWLLVYPSELLALRELEISRRGRGQK